MALLFGACRSLNRLDNHGQRTGRWKVYLDSAKTIRSFEGRFRKGKPVGLAKYYDMNGAIARKERNRGKMSYTTLYHSDGKVSDRGRARMDESTTTLHYYFEGWWEHYSDDGKIEKLVLYEKGKILQTKYVNADVSLNNSLTFVLNELEKNFLAQNAALLDSLNRYSYMPSKRESLLMELYGNDTTTFQRLEQIISRFGYPSEKQVGTSSNIPFYILSHGPLYLREKNIQMLRTAADSGKLSWTSLAFYLDKISVAKGEAQQYGTQFYFDDKGRMLYYPSVSQDTLIENRKRVGLD